MSISLKSCSNEHLLNVLKNTKVRPHAPLQTEIDEYNRIQSVVNIADRRIFAMRVGSYACTDDEMQLYTKAFRQEIKRICAYPPIGWKEPHCAFLHSYA